jgi:hypothetical protein
LVCQYFGIKSFIMSPICIFPFGCCERHLCHCRFTDFTAYRGLNNKWTNMASSESFMALSMVAKHNRRPRLYLRHLLLLFRGYPHYYLRTLTHGIYSQIQRKTSFLLLN